MGRGVLPTQIKGGLIGARLIHAPDGHPATCPIHATDRCDLDCGHCDAYDNARFPMWFEVPEQRMRWVEDLGCTRPSLPGGEPLMHPDSVEAARFCARETALPATTPADRLPLTGRPAPN